MVGWIILSFVIGSIIGYFFASLMIAASHNSDILNLEDVNIKDVNLNIKKK